MKRGRDSQLGALREPPQSDIIKDHKSWLLDTISEGDSDVLNALLQIEMGNPEPLRNLVDGCNTDLRGRLVKLSEEGAFMISSDSDTGLVYDFRAATISERADGKETAEPPDDLNMVFREIGDALSAVFDPTQAFSEEPQVPPPGTVQVK